MWKKVLLPLRHKKYRCPSPDDGRPCDDDRPCAALSPGAATAIRRDYPHRDSFLRPGYGHLLYSLTTTERLGLNSVTRSAPLSLAKSPWGGVPNSHPPERDNFGEAGCGAKRGDHTLPASPDSARVGVTQTAGACFSTQICGEDSGCVRCSPPDWRGCFPLRCG